VRVFWSQEVSDDWSTVLAELERAFAFSKEAAGSEESFVYVVRGDDLLGRRGPGNAMVATGLLSAARTAALEGWSKGWTANVIAWNGEDRAVAEALARHLLDCDAVTGELVHVGPSHVGKALP
jgi:hypothetical protein